MAAAAMSLAPAASEVPLARSSELERALDDDAFFITFLDFCRLEHSAENILFWRAICDFEAIAIDLGDPTNGAAVPEPADLEPPEQVINAQLAVARGLLVKYIRAGAVHEVNMREVSPAECQPCPPSAAHSTNTEATCVGRQAPLCFVRSLCVRVARGMTATHTQSLCAAELPLNE